MSSVVTGSNDPRRFYHGLLRMSPKQNIHTPMASPAISNNMERNARRCSPKKGIAEPEGISTLKIERVPENSRFVSSARMRWT